MVLFLQADYSHDGKKSYQKDTGSQGGIKDSGPISSHQFDKEVCYVCSKKKFQFAMLATIGNSPISMKTRLYVDVPVIFTLLMAPDVSKCG